MRRNREVLIEKYIKPSEVDIFGDEFWYNGLGDAHSLNGQPAMVYYYDYDELHAKYWFKNGKQHRNGDKPAEICYENGIIVCERWYRNGECIKEKMLK